MMDRNYIQNEHIVDRYLSGELTVREAREFEKYCLEHPTFLNEMPIPVRLKARLSRRPMDTSETGVFQAIPSSATRAALEVNDEGFDAEEEKTEWRSNYGGGGSNRVLVMGLAVALLAAICGLVAYGLHARGLSEKMQQMQRAMQVTQMQAPTSTQKYRLQFSRSQPQQATLELGWMQPPQLLELSFDASEGAYSAYQITIDKIDGGRIMQIRRIARDSNKELKLGLNSSAFGPGDYLLKFDGYTWRGQLEEVGWVRLGLK